MKQPCFEIQARVGGQYNISSNFRSIYQTWSPVYQLELSSGNIKGVYGWLNGGWTGCNGHTTQFDSKTKVSIVPLSAGLKYAFYENKYMFFYVGAGASYTHLFVHDYSPFHSYSKQWHWGCVAKSGIRFFMPAGTFSELFIDYNYLPFSFNHSIDVGGLLIGLSFGWSL